MDDRSAGRPTRTVAAAKFRQQCLRLLDEVSATGEGLIVTKHGRSVAAVVPVTDEMLPRLVGWCPDIVFNDDLTDPAVPVEQWHVVSDPERVLTGVPSDDR